MHNLQTLIVVALVAAGSAIASPLPTVMEPDVSIVAPVVCVTETRISLTPEELEVLRAEQPDVSGADRVHTSYSVGSKVRLGDAVVTAEHVVKGCASTDTPIEAVWSSQQRDFSILEVGDPGVCRNALEGEELLYAGYPGLDGRGRLRVRKDLSIDMEVDTGTYVEKSPNIWITDVSRGGLAKLLVGTYLGSHNFVRGGYSGGAVLSSVDGRPVGIISSGNTEGDVLFVPIEDICQQINHLRNK